MLIGALASRAGVTRKALRFYEEAGVLPEPSRTASGYRDYPDDAVDRLAFIHAARAAGLTLAEIRTIISIRDDGDAPCAHVVGLLDAKASAVSRQLAQLEDLKVELDRLRERAAGVDPAGCDPRRVCDVLTPPS